MKKAKEKDPVENPSLRKTINLFADIFQTLKPPPKLTIDTWADSYRILSSKTSAEPGRWKTDRVPFQREVMKAISDKKLNRKHEMFLNFFTLSNKSL